MIRGGLSTTAGSEFPRACWILGGYSAKPGSEARRRAKFFRRRMCCWRNQEPTWRHTSPHNQGKSRGLRYRTVFSTKSNINRKLPQPIQCIDEYWDRPFSKGGERYCIFMIASEEKWPSYLKRNLVPGGTSSGGTAKDKMASFLIRGFISWGCLQKNCLPHERSFSWSNDVRRNSKTLQWLSRACLVRDPPT